MWRHASLTPQKSVALLNLPLTRCGQFSNTENLHRKTSRKSIVSNTSTTTVGKRDWGSIISVTCAWGDMHGVMITSLALDVNLLDELTLEGTGKSDL